MVLNLIKIFKYLLERAHIDKRKKEKVVHDIMSRLGSESAEIAERTGLPKAALGISVNDRKNSQRKGSLTGEKQEFINLLGVAYRLPKEVVTYKNRATLASVYPNFLTPRQGCPAADASAYDPMLIICQFAFSPNLCQSYSCLRTSSNSIFPEKVIVKATTVFYIIVNGLFIPSRKEVSRRRKGLNLGMRYAHANP